MDCEFIILENTDRTSKKYQRLLKGTLKLLNSEWSRSETARLRSLDGGGRRIRHLIIVAQEEHSCQEDEGDDSVVGHVSLTLEWNPLNKKDDVSNILIQSVVIHPRLRGRGLGSQLMQQTESFCVSTAGLEWIQSPCHAIRLILHPKNDKDGSVERFYEGLGFARYPDDDNLPPSDLQTRTRNKKSLKNEFEGIMAVDHDDGVIDAFSTLSSHHTLTSQSQGGCPLVSSEANRSQSSCLSSAMLLPPPPPSSDGKEVKCNTTPSFINSKKGKMMFKIIRPNIH